MGKSHCDRVVLVWEVPHSCRRAGHIAKYYLTDGRRNPDSQGYKAGAALEKFLRDSGVRVAFNRDFALTALRWAAMQAGIGIVRKNFLLYGKGLVSVSGSVPYR